MNARACDACMARSWLVGRLAGHLDKARSRIEHVLALDDDALVVAIGGRETARLEREFETVDLDSLRSRTLAAGLETVCGCDPAYPPGLRALVAPPAVLSWPTLSPPVSASPPSPLTAWPSTPAGP